jgi:hypothetical protein
MKSQNDKGEIGCMILFIILMFLLVYFLGKYVGSLDDEVYMEETPAMVEYQ